MLKVVVSGIFYPVTMMQYFIRAFQRREDVKLFTTGPFFGNFIPWNYGMTIPDKYVYTPDLPLPPQAMQFPTDPKIVEDKLPWKPDLWLQIDAGWHFASRPPANLVALVKTDPHVINFTYEAAKSYSDITFCMQNEYISNGEYFLPYAFDPTIHYPMDIPKEYDTCLIGLQYTHRVSLMNELKRQGISVFTGIGIVYDDYRIAYNKARVALSWSSLKDTPARVWEAFGMDLPLVVNRTPDLKSFFVEGEHYLGFDDITEGVKQVKRFLDDPDFAYEVAGNAYRKVQKFHTWDARIEQILETVKLI